MRSRHRGVLAAVVLAAFCGSTWATCAEGALASQTEQMACCKAGHDHCPMTDSASDCCQKSGPQVQSQATVVKAAPLSTPVRGLLAWVTLPVFASIAQPQLRVSYDASPSGVSLSPPAYIAFSALLI
jgi:hypothetical protein